MSSMRPTASRFGMHASNTVFLWSTHHRPQLMGAENMDTGMIMLVWNICNRSIPMAFQKTNFDRWALAQAEGGNAPYFWAGLKFFNVFGPNEFHKGRMASVVFHTFNQVKATGAMKLFRSHRADYVDGGQTRDFVYVKDLVDVCLFLMHHRRPSSNGLYNLGTGEARTFLDLAKATFAAMDKKPEISFIDTPEDIRDTYQYFTEADMSKLRSIGYDLPFRTLEDAILDYVKNHLVPGLHWKAPRT